MVKQSKTLDSTRMGLVTLVETVNLLKVERRRKKSSKDSRKRLGFKVLDKYLPHYLSVVKRNDCGIDTKIGVLKT